jgi:hypothetical protein
LLLAEADLADVLKTLAGAPTLNLLVILGAVLVVAAGAGRFPKVGRLDMGGRLFCGTSAALLLVVAVIVVLRMNAVRQQPPEDRSTSPVAGAPGPPALAPVPTAMPAAPPPEEGAARRFDRRLERFARALPMPTPVAPGPGLAMAVAPIVLKELSSPSTYVEFGCEEQKTVTVSLTLPQNARFTSAQVVIRDLANARWFKRGKPSFDPLSRMVTADVAFQGLDRVFLNCPGGGHARASLTANVMVPGGAR